MVQKVAVAKTKLEIVSEIVAVELPAELITHPALQGVSQQTLTSLANRFDVVKVPRGASIYQVEDEAKALYLVTIGAVRTQHKNAQGETLESSYVRELAILGAGEMLARAETMFECAVAVDSITAFALPISLMAELAARDPILLLNLAKALADRHQQAILNEKEALEPAFVRVAHHLTTLSNREGKIVAPDLYLVHTTQDDIAAASGLNPRTVSRAMKVLQQKGRLYIRRGEYLLRQPLTLAQAFAAQDLE
jgi:CRP-like cAMP-binding protein